MTERAIILPEAERDMREAYAWYEERRRGLGEEFLRCVDACILAIRRNPEMSAFACQNYRRALVRRFPYAIFYEFQEDTVVIYSVFHCSQDPEKWRRRLP